MIVFHPHTVLRPAVQAVLTAEGLPVLPLFMEAPDSYHAALGSLWARGEGFLVLEHDVLPHPGALRELAACPEPWCAFPYDIGGPTRPCLGCSKFGPQLLARCPRLFEDWRGERGWRLLDRQLEAELAGAGARVHVHEPAVVHLRLGTSSARALQTRGAIGAARARLEHLG